VWSNVKAVYLATRKRHDQLFNTYLMRPLAAVLVVALGRLPVTPNQLTLAGVVIFAGAAAVLVAVPTRAGDWLAVGLIELAYLFDCCDGMLARHRKQASQQGHLFDFFTDEIKAIMLTGAIAVRLWRTGGHGPLGARWPVGAAGFLLGGIAAVAIISSATSLTNFVRRPEISGQPTPVEAHHESARASAAGGGGWLRRAPLSLLRFIGHYPSHIWLWGALARWDLFFWAYATIHVLYLGRGWLGLAWRFGRPSA